LIDAQTGQRVDVLASRKADVVEAWLRDHPGVEIVCRDGSGAYGEAVRGRCPARSRLVTAGICGTAWVRRC
jgi:transposase